jgi:hypothetical protein
MTAYVTLDKNHRNRYNRSDNHARFHRNIRCVKGTKLYEITSLTRQRNVEQVTANSLRLGDCRSRCHMFCDVLVAHVMSLQQIVFTAQVPQVVGECSRVSWTIKAIPVTGSGGQQGCEMLRIPHCRDNRLAVNCEILATCSSTYSPVRTSQEAHSVSIK